MNTVKTQNEAITDLYSADDLPEIKKVWLNDSYIYFQLSNQNTIRISISHTKLLDASPDQRNNYKLTPHFVFWDDIDEIIGVKNLLNGSLIKSR